MSDTSAGEQHFGPEAHTVGAADPDEREPRDLEEIHEENAAHM